MAKTISDLEYGGAIDVESCPGCGRCPGEGLDPDCESDAGCGYWRALYIELGLDPTA